MDITYYGHACFAINTKSKSLLFDPFISSNELAKEIDIDKIKCDYILISHGHGDHVEDAERIGKNNNPTFISNFEIINWIGEKGFEKVHALNHGGSWNFDFGKVKYVNAIHSSVLPDGSYGGNPGGFILEIEGIRIYYAGDTALHYDMKLIGEYESPDFAILPIGDNFTMGIDDAIRAAKMIDCQHIIGMHFDTFPPIEINHEEAINKFKRAGIKLTLMKIGSSLSLS